MAAVQFGGAASVPGMAGASGGAAPVNVGVQGGDGQKPTGVTAPTDYFTAGMVVQPSGRNWPGFLEEVFKAPLQAAAQERQFKGFVDAVKGTTTEEIRESQPWYSKLFGPTQYETGAMMYESQTAVSELTREFATQMPELRKLPSEQVTQILAERLDGMQKSANNPFTSMILQKTATEQFGALMEMHTKERVGWQQAELVRGQVDANFAAGSALQALSARAALLGDQAPNDPQVAESLLLADRAFMDTLQAGYLQNDESIKQFVMTSFRRHADAGNLYPLQAMRRAGLMDALSAEDQQRAEAIITAAENKARSRFASERPDFTRAVWEIQANVTLGVGAEKMIPMIDEADRWFKAETGSSAGYFSDEQRAGFMASSSANWYRRFERQEDRLDRANEAAANREADAAAKAAAEARNVVEAQQSFRSGTMGQTAILKDVSKADLDRYAYEEYQVAQSANPELAAGMLVFNANNGTATYVNDILAKQFQDNFKNSLDEQVSDGFMAQYENWLQIYSAPGAALNSQGEVEWTDKAHGPAAARMYYGEAINDRLLQFHNRYTTFGDQAAAYRNVFGDVTAGTTVDVGGLSREDSAARLKAFEETISGLDPSWWSRTFGDAVPLQEASKREMMVHMANVARSLPVNLSPENLMSAAWRVMQRENNSEVLGGVFVDSASNQKPLRNWLGDADPSNGGERTSRFFGAALRHVARKSGIDWQDVDMQVIRRQDGADGEPMFTVMVASKDGFDFLNVTGNDVRASMEYERRKSREHIDGPVARDNARRARAVEAQREANARAYRNAVPNPFR